VKLGWMNWVDLMDGLNCIEMGWVNWMDGLNCINWMVLVELVWVN